MNACADHVVSYLLAQSWQIALLAGMVGLISWILRERSAHIRYLLWVIVLAKCLVPPLLTVPLGVLPEGSAGPSMASVGLPEGHSAPERPVSVGADPRPQDSQPARFSLSEWIALVWAMGAFSFLMWVGGRAVRYTAWLRDRRRPLSPALEEAIQELSVDFKLKRLPRIWLLEDISQPFVWGVLRGSVYLPSDFVGLSGSDRPRSVLAHELSHVARFDAGVNLLQVLAQAVYWFHPLVWWSNRKIRQEREMCCDEMAIVHLNAQPEQYTGAIVDALIEERRSTHPIPSLAIVGSVRDIEERIKTMLKPGKRFHKRPSLVATTVALLLALVTIPTALVLTARGEGQPTAQSVAKPAQLPNKPAAGSEKPEQPQFVARTFNSSVAFDVFALETSGGRWKTVGRTSNATPLEIPACWLWWVRPSAPVEDWDFLVREMSQNKVPGLELGSATDSDLKHVAAGVRELQRLGLSNTQITDAGLAHLAGLTRLQWLDLGSTKVTDAGLEYLKGLTRLQSLQLKNTQVTDAGLAHLAGLARLQFLDLESTQITDAGLEHLEGLTGLRTLNVVGTQIMDAGVGHLKDLTGLEVLLLPGELTDAGIEHVKGLTRLQTLYLGGKITDAGLIHIKGMTGLRWLGLHSSQITDVGIEHIRGLTGLEDLFLHSTQLTDAGLVHLKALTRLQNLDVADSQITDAGLEHLKGLTTLRVLNLSSTKITDAGLEHLQGLTGLEAIVLDDTRVTDAGVRQLKKSLPKLTIVRDQAK